jgi:glycerol-3-phosphate dehydrogenase (NAD(P)+)
VPVPGARRVAMSAAQQPGGHAVTLWARDGQPVADMQARRQNTRYLPGIAFPPALLAGGRVQTLW